MNKDRFDTEQEANDYKVKHHLANRVAEPTGGGNWGLVFPTKSHVQVNDGAPAGARQLRLPAKLEWSTVADQPEIGVSLKDYFVTNPLYDVGLINKVDPQECWGLSQEQANFIVGLNEQLSEAVEDAINAACLRLQNFAGITAGGYAGIHFSDPAIRNKLMEVFAAYIVDDVNHRGD